MTAINPASATLPRSVQSRISWRRTASGGIGAGEQHADHRAGEEDQPRGLRGVDEGDHARAQAPANEGRGCLGGGRPKGQGRLELSGVREYLVAEPVERDGRRRHRVAHDHAAHDEILTDLIVQIPRDFLSFLLADAPKLGSEGFGNLIKSWKFALLESRVAHFSMLV